MVSRLSDYVEIARVLMDDPNWLPLKDLNKIDEHAVPRAEMLVCQSLSQA